MQTQPIELKTTDKSDRIALRGVRVHAVLRADISRTGRILVYGGGILGLGVVAGLRAAGYSGTIDAVIRHDIQGRLARRMGADEVLDLPRSAPHRFARIAERTGARLHRVRLANLTLAGGYDVVFCCAGSKAAIGECLKWTANRGQMVLVGTGAGRVEATEVWFGELTVIGAYGRGVEQFDGRAIRTYDLVHEWMLTARLETEGLVTHRFGPEQYKQALATVMNKSAHRAVKVVLDFRP
jgi:threonine dehydrogenase-like Zn-dependent dehydrogenase